MSELLGIPVAGELVLSRRRGRPAGQKMAIAADQLRLTHFSYLRALILGVDLSKAWDIFNLEFGPDDLRFRAARTRQLLGQVRAAARERGMEADAELALAGLDSLVPRPALAVAKPAGDPEGVPTEAALPGLVNLPALDDWIEEYCSARGLDRDALSEGEWLAAYREEFALDQPASLLAAIAIEAPSPALSEPSTPAPPLPNADLRVAAMNKLATALGRPISLDDPLGSWLTPELTRRLANAAVDGKPLPLLTVKNLIGMVNVYHHRWWVHVPRLGAERASRVTAWLAPLAAKLGSPLHKIALVPLAQFKREQSAELALLKEESRFRFGLVPLDRLAVPPDLDGRQGLFRSHEVNTLKVDNDRAAIFAWLENFTKKPRTLKSYSLIVERFYLWCVLVKRVPMSSLGVLDFRQYEAFLAKPPADWVQARRAGRETSEWRPFKGPLSTASIKLNFTVIASLFASLLEAGYLRANGMRDVAKSMKRQAHRMNIDRSFNDGQWAWVMNCWRDMYRECGPLAGAEDEQPLVPTVEHPDRAFLRAAALRRTRLLLDLGSTTGLRLIEFVTTRRRALKQDLVEGQLCWLLTVVGKGDKERLAVIYDDIKELIDQHHRDMERAGTHFESQNLGVRTLNNPDAKPPRPPETDEEKQVAAEQANAQFDPLDLPLIGSLRGAVRAKDPNKPAPRNSDRNGALDPTAMYQSLKRFLLDCARRATASGAEIDVGGLERASTHWMRHFFANSAVNDKVDLAALRDALGHASLATTSIYVRTERNRLVSEMGKMKRRGG